MLRTPSDSHFGGDDSKVAWLEDTVHSRTDAVTVPDAHLLFHGDFKRAAGDLIISDEKHKFVVHDYFKFEKHPTLLSPNGAGLTPDVVDALAGPLAPGEYAQATAPHGQAQAIGRVAVVTGSATVVRNGVAIALNVGDAILKNDVVQTGSGSKLGITFTDGTTFALNANARMVINEFVYDPNGTHNSALLNLVQGSIQFVAGKVAHTGDMRVSTPVATMGIRGTAVNVDINANDGTTHFSVMVEPKGATGSYNLYDKTTGTLIGTVSNSSVGWVVRPVGPAQVVAAQYDKTPVQLQQELAIVQQVFNIQAIGEQILQQADQNTRAGDGHGSSTPVNFAHEDSGHVTSGTVTVSSDTGSGLNSQSTSSTKTATETIIPPVVSL